MTIYEGTCTEVSVGGVVIWRRQLEALRRAGYTGSEGEQSVSSRPPAPTAPSAASAQPCSAADVDVER